MAKSCVEIVARHFNARPPVEPGAWNVLLHAGSMLKGLTEALEAMLAAAIEKGVARDAAIAMNAGQSAQMWIIRERMATLEGREGPMLTHDVSVPIDKIPELLARAGSVMADRFPRVRPYPFGHVGDGNLHYNIFVPADAPNVDITRALHQIVIDLGGSISAEHGVGRYRRDELPLNKSAEEVALMRRIKKMMDPDGIINPGAVL